jgi:hypothetical protein
VLTYLAERAGRLVLTLTPNPWGIFDDAVGPGNEVEDGWTPKGLGQAHRSIRILASRRLRARRCARRPRGDTRCKADVGNSVAEEDSAALSSAWFSRRSFAWRLNSR